MPCRIVLQSMNKGSKERRTSENCELAWTGTIDRLCNKIYSCACVFHTNKSVGEYEAIKNPAEK